MNSASHPFNMTVEPNRSNPDKALFVIGLGVASNLSVAFWVTHTEWGDDLYRGLMAGFVPIGALLCGFLGAIGFLGGSFFLHHKLQARTLIAIAVLAVLTHVVIHYFRYEMETVRSTPVSRLLSFPRYYQLEAEHKVVERTQSYGRAVDRTNLGKWGWAYAGLEVIGFTLGGLFAGLITHLRPYCDKCGRYKKKTDIFRQYDTLDKAKTAYLELLELLEGRNWQDAINKHVLLGERRLSGIAAVVRVEIHQCPKCLNSTLSLSTIVGGAKNPKTIGQRTFELDTPVSITEDPRAKKSFQLSLP